MLASNWVFVIRGSYCLFEADGQSTVRQVQQPGQPVFFFFRIRSSARRTMSPTAARMDQSQKFMAVT
jgi:hypothetical protein